MMSVYSVGNDYAAGGLGSRWQPKENRIRVGRDVAALTSTGFSGRSANSMVLGHGDDVTLKSRELFQFAMSSAQAGHQPQSFRALSRGFGQEGNSFVVPKAATLATQGDFTVSYDSGSGMVRIFEKNAETDEYALVQSVAARQDIKISWGEDGKPQVLAGSDALTMGNLEATGQNEVLIRVSDADVLAGSGTTVMNLSSSAGNFSGGDKVTYLGSYRDSVFTGTAGDVNFAGYFSGSTFSELAGSNSFSGVFEHAEVDAAKGRNEFKGYFSASAITGGKERYTASGLFINGSTILGSSDDDAFSGRFVDSEVSGGDGNDSFGNAQSISNSETLTYKSGGIQATYSAIAADFVNSSVNAGAGNDSFKGVMWGGTLNLEQGENTVKGVFGQTTVNGGSGNDELTAVYSDTSIFNTGIGDDSVALLSSVLSTINTGEGTNKVAVGLNASRANASTWQNRNDYFSQGRPVETGELQNNTINAEKGENQIAVHNGESTIAVLSGDIYETSTRKAAQAEEAPASKDSADETAETREPVPLLTEQQQAFPQAQQYAAVAQLMQTPQVLRTDASGWESDTENGLGERKVRHALGRYKSFLGSEPFEQGDPAVTVNTADGKSKTFNGIARHNEFEGDADNTKGMVRNVRRAGADGSFSWNRWEHVA